MVKEHDSVINVKVLKGHEPARAELTLKFINEHAKEIEHEIGTAIKKLGWKGMVWVTIERSHSSISK